MIVTLARMWWADDRMVEKFAKTPALQPYLDYARVQRYALTDIEAGTVDFYCEIF